MDLIAQALHLVATRRARRPARALPALNALFQHLSACTDAREADATVDRIWELWMYHPHRSAAQIVELATRDIAAERYDIAETRLTLLLKHLRTYAEAWHKRASLYYLLGRDRECVGDLVQVLDLEPRHFGAILHLAEILGGDGNREAAKYAFAAALSLNPHSARAREMLTHP